MLAGCICRLASIPAHPPAPCLVPAHDCAHLRAHPHTRPRTMMASTAICEKKSASEPTILDDIEVLAAVMMESRPSLSVLMAMCSSMNLHACSTGARAPALLSAHHPKSGSKSAVGDC